MVGHWLWKPWKKGQRARGPWGYAPGHADQLLDLWRIMASTPNEEVAVHVRDPPANIVTPIPLGATLPDFTEWALPYLFVEDAGQDVGDLGGLEKVAGTTRLQPWEVRLVQHLVAKPLQGKPKYIDGDRAGLYRTIDLLVWRDAYNCLDSVSFLRGDFCTSLGVYMASLLHGVEQCLGTLGVRAPVPMHVGANGQSGCGSCPMLSRTTFRGATERAEPCRQHALPAVLGMAPRLHVA